MANRHNRGTRRYKDERKRSTNRKITPIRNAQNRRPHQESRSATKWEKKQVEEYASQVNIIICDRFIRARVSSDRQETRIGTEVAQLVKEKTRQQMIKRVMDTGYGRGVQNVLNVRLGTRMSRLRDMDCIIDYQLPPRTAALGMQALKLLGYSITVGGRDAYQTVSVKTVAVSRVRRPTVRESTPKREKDIPFFEKEDELVIRVDPVEARRIERAHFRR